MKNGDEIEAKILEVDVDELKYKTYSNPEGPVHTVLKSDIFMIKYENGEKETFSDGAANDPAGYENFTTSERAGTWALNSVLPGLGSFVIMKDKVGGGIQAAAGGAGLILWVIGVAVTVDANVNLKSRTVDNGTYYGYNMPETTEYYVDQQALSGGIACIVIGGILWTGSGIFNIIRSVRYNKPVPTVASGFDPAGLQIVLIPPSSGNKVSLSLSYTMHF